MSNDKWVLLSLNGGKGVWKKIYYNNKINFAQTQKKNYIFHSYTCHYILILVICFIYLFSLYKLSFNVGNGGLPFIMKFYENIILDHHLLQSMMMTMDNKHVCSSHLDHKTILKKKEWSMRKKLCGYLKMAIMLRNWNLRNLVWWQCSVGDGWKKWEH